MESMYLDDLLIHRNSGSTDIFVQTPIEGLDAPDYRTNIYERVGEHGARITNQLYGSREIKLQGVIKGDNPSLYEDNRFLFSQAIAINRDEYGTPVAKRLRFTTLAGYTYFIDVHVARKPVFSNIDINYCKFLLTLVAPDPLIRGETIVSSGAIARPSGGGFILPVVLPITSSAAIGGTAVLNNNGSEDSYPIITITGQATNPYIINATTGKVMQLNYTIPAGSSVVIDMAEKTITLDETGNLLYTKSDDSEWFVCAPGSTTINFNTGSSGDTGTMLVEFYPGYVAV